ncbi:MAG: pyruvate dehydrogenase (acetyl-transferring) E1 component subunit alpha [Deltaproteobacteria bacterium]|nr:pyruvate dehydrogenase (acetyl-transferring) E1 component subunit alpha [Deltaproteobacteria bacterium]
MSAELDAGHARKLLGQMLLIRRFEERCAELYGAGKIRGFLHLYIGQEAVAVGALQALHPEDAIVASYRDHGLALARGISASAVMAEMFGRVSGCSRGRGGSMHLFDATTRFFGGNAIVAGGLPLAVGLALADKLQNRRRVTACFFGDGAVAEGAFHESMNLASLWRLPVLFACENNRYAMGTAIERHQAQLDLPLKARGYNVPGKSVDGMEVLAVEDATRRAAERIRAEGTPQFLEYQTYRFRAHSAYDPELYRPKAEVESWKKRDPLDTFPAKLRYAGLLSDKAMAELEAEVASTIEQAVAFADAAPWEPIEDLTRFVCAAGSQAHATAEES